MNEEQEKRSSNNGGTDWNYNRMHGRNEGGISSVKRQSLERMRISFCENREREREYEELREREREYEELTQFYWEKAREQIEEQEEESRRRMIVIFDRI